jgi:adenylyltransferase/sulfurtransferase
MPEPPPAEFQPTCETAGVIGPIVSVVASMQSAEALKILSGRRDAVNRRLSIIDLWGNQLRSIGVDNVRVEGCRTCGQREFPWLEGRRGAAAVTLCGRNSVQLAPAEPGGVSLTDLAAKLKHVGRVSGNSFLLRLEVDKYHLTVFADGRTIVAGTTDPAEARVVHARYVGG